MKILSIKMGLVAAIASALLITAVLAADEAPKIRLNTIGYQPAKEKKATIAAECSRFSVIQIKDNAKVLEGTATGPVVNSDTNEQLYTADFSAIKEPGEYQLDIPGVEKSAPFRVAGNVYNQPFYTVMRGMYLWRCGTAVKGVYNGTTYRHGICHASDAYLDYVDGGRIVKPSLKGWHDAGDYNKYVVNAGITLGTMFLAWEQFESVLSKIILDIPESGGTIPDYLHPRRRRFLSLFKEVLPELPCVIFG